VNTELTKDYSNVFAHITEELFYPLLYETKCNGLHTWNALTSRTVTVEDPRFLWSLGNAFILLILPTRSFFHPKVTVTTFGSRPPGEAVSRRPAFEFKPEVKDLNHPGAARIASLIYVS